MRFGQILKASIYEPWKSYYIDYARLKILLREDDANRWTEEEESRFTDELVNVQLEKVNAFQVDTHKALRDRTAQCEAQLEDWLILMTANEEGAEGASGIDGTEGPDQPMTDAVLSQVLRELDDISKDMHQLEKYSRINFTGFLKACKKHDRR